MISRGWKAGVKAPDPEAARKRGLDSGRASATLVISGECHFGSALLHAYTKSVTDLMFMSGSLPCGLLDGVWDWS